MRILDWIVTFVGMALELRGRPGDPTFETEDRTACYSAIDTRRATWGQRRRQRGDRALCRRPAERRNDLRTNKGNGR